VIGVVYCALRFYLRFAFCSSPLVFGGLIRAHSVVLTQLASDALRLASLHRSCTLCNVVLGRLAFSDTPARWSSHGALSARVTPWHWYGAFAFCTVALGAWRLVTHMLV